MVEEGDLRNEEGAVHLLSDIFDGMEPQPPNSDHRDTTHDPKSKATAPQAQAAVPKAAKLEAGEANFEVDDHHDMGESSRIAGGNGRRGGGMSLRQLGSFTVTSNSNRAGNSEDDVLSD